MRSQPGCLQGDPEGGRREVGAASVCSKLVSRLQRRAVCSTVLLDSLSSRKDRECHPHVTTPQRNLLTPAFHSNTQNTPHLLHACTYMQHACHDMQQRGDAFAWRWPRERVARWVVTQVLTLFFALQLPKRHTTQHNMLTAFTGPRSRASVLTG